MDEAGDIEYNRQQDEPGTNPASGYPKFSRRTRFEDIPAPGPAPGPPPAPPPGPPPEPPPPGPVPGPGDTPPEPPSPEPPREPREPGRRGPVDLGRVVVDRPAGEAPGPDWRKLDERRYAGLTIKPVREILATPRDAQLFGEMLQAVNPETAASVLERYSAGNPTKEDQDFMTFGVHEYALRLKFAGETSGMITKEEVRLLSRRNKKEVLNLITHEGEERATEMVKNAIFHMAMKNPGAVEEMKNAFKQIGRDRETSRYEQAEKRINALCARVGIRLRDYNSVFKLNSLAGRRATADDLTKRYHDNAGKFRRAIDWLQSNPKFTFGAIAPLPGSSRFAATGAMQTADLLANDATYRMFTSNALRRIDENLESIARHLGSTISNPNMQRLVTQEVITNQNQKLASEGGPSSFEQVQSLSRERFSPASIEKRIRERMSKPDWPKGDISAQDSIVRDMMNSERREHAGSGFWAWFFGAIFGQNWSKGANAALGRTMHV